MPRVIEISVPSEVTDRLVAQLREIDGLIGLRVQRNISLQPPSDVVTIDASNRSLHAARESDATLGDRSPRAIP